MSNLIKNTSTEDQDDKFLLDLSNLSIHEEPQMTQEDYSLMVAEIKLSSANVWRHLHETQSAEGITDGRTTAGAGSAKPDGRTTAGAGSAKPDGRTTAGAGSAKPDGRTTAGAGSAKPDGRTISAMKEQPFLLALIEDLKHRHPIGLTLASMMFPSISN
jgi:hypothetical protein